MPGEQFSRSHVHPGGPGQDSTRARYRVGALFGETGINSQVGQLASYLGRELGVPVPGEGRRASNWHAFIRECPTSEFLDTITVVYRYLFWHAGEESANRWRDGVRRVFVEEHLAYEIDDIGGVHPRVDREFQENLTSAVAGLQSENHRGVRELVESASKYLHATPPNHRQALQLMLSAAETLFGQMFPHVRLSAEEIERRLRPVVQRAYDGDEPAQRAAGEMLTALKAWVEASHEYSRRPGDVDPVDPPADIAILAISQGASFLRWLARLGVNPA
ncbi:MAG: hypothetical protein ACREV8_15230 [Gammaproteobacteria bacterium]